MYIARNFKQNLNFILPNRPLKLAPSALVRVGALAGPRRGNFVAFDVRSHSDSTPRCCTINSCACYPSKERSKYQVGALNNGC